VIRLPVSSLTTQIDLDIAQRLSVSQIYEGHGKELIQASEVLDFEIVLMASHAAAKSAQWQMCHELREHKLALMHGDLVRKTHKTASLTFDVQTETSMKMLKSLGKSVTYDALLWKCWDTTNLYCLVEKNISTPQGNVMLSWSMLFSWLIWCKINLNSEKH
jgi:hypothetical protein